MSLSWAERKDLLSSLLQARNDDDDNEGIALDRVLHGQNAIGKTSKTIRIDSLRFTDKDLVVLGTLDRGQFGVIDVVNCVMDGRVYVRKSIERAFALRSREQCSPKIERDILILARHSNTIWAPHLLCSFQTSTHLNLVMDYLEGGTLWDVLESSPHGGRVLEVDLEWWAPQAAVIGLVQKLLEPQQHSDIKPHNFVLTSSFHLLLIDFGSAAPLSPPEPDGSQNIPQRHSLVPCGTCDYISPEILQAHEDALLALELSDQSPAPLDSEQPANTCGLETDWWSLGVMLYELVYGVTPFFANDIRTTYLKIINHETSLCFDKSVPVSEPCRDLLQRLLSSRERRLGRRDVLEITEHPFFKYTHWARVGMDDTPPELHVPHFTYTTPAVNSPGRAPPVPEDDSVSHPFHFSALFQSSVSTSPGLSILRSAPRVTPGSGSPSTEAAFIGFSWGPPRDAFPPSDGNTNQSAPEVLKTPRPLLPIQSSPYPLHGRSVASNNQGAFVTPVRPHNAALYHTLPRTSTVGRTPMRRAVSDREAMRQLVDCIGMSARKKVLASGRKPRILGFIDRSRSTAIKKALGYGAPPIITSADKTSSYFPPVHAASESEATESGSEGPPSPSPSPRPGSAMSILSRRSTTPTRNAVSHSTRFLNLPSSSMSEVHRTQEHRDEGEDLDDEVFSLLEKRHAVLVSQLYSMQTRIDRLREFIEP